MIIRKVKEEEKVFIEDFVLEIFRDSTPYSDGVLEKALVREIREGKYYIPEFDLVAEEDGKIVGHYMMSKFPISGAVSYTHLDVYKRQVYDCSSNYIFIIGIYCFIWWFDYYYSNINKM